MKPLLNLGIRDYSSVPCDRQVKAGRSERKGAGGRGRRIALRDLLLFTRQFAVLIRAGVNLSACLKIMEEQAENPLLAEVITGIRRDVESGNPLHQALERFPKVFPSIYIHMVEAGETGGQLETVLERLAEYFEREFMLRKKIIGALAYPVVIAVVAVIAVVLVMVLIMPVLLRCLWKQGSNSQARPKYSLPSAIS